MKADVPVTNNTKMTLWVGPYMVAPGETKILPAHHVPEHLHLGVADDADEHLSDVDQVTYLLAANATVVVNDLHNLSDEELARAKALEVEGKARKSVLAAIAELELSRANAAELRKALEGLTEASILVMRDSYPVGAEEIDIIDDFMRARGFGPAV